MPRPKCAPQPKVSDARAQAIDGRCGSPIGADCPFASNLLNQVRQRLVDLELQQRGTCRRAEPLFGPRRSKIAIVRPVGNRASTVSAALTPAPTTAMSTLVLSSSHE